MSEPEQPSLDGGFVGHRASVRSNSRDSSSSKSSRLSSTSDTSHGDEGLDLDSDCQGAADYKRQYLGTWSNPKHGDHKSPGSMSKMDFGTLVMQVVERVFGRRNRLCKMAVFDEPHADGTVHKHFAMLCEKPWAYHQVVKELRSEGIYVWFSASHDYYWTTLVYLCVPGTGSNDKKAEHLDPSPWLSPGHPTVKEQLMDIPRGARRCDKDRVRAFLGLDKDSIIARLSW